MAPLQCIVRFYWQPSEPVAATGLFRPRNTRVITAQKRKSSISPSCGRPTTLIAGNPTKALWCVTLASRKPVETTNRTNAIRSPSSAQNPFVETDLPHDDDAHSSGEPRSLHHRVDRGPPH